MKYYVIINGNSSLNIQGLAIESLPNISKPLIRTSREEIDGRDGDIITKLGYSAYDKTLNIGLWGNYDINEVIAFFNQEGVITFSNEPDKYYKFTIVNRIDFVNELEKFKKASITIHCQPFKYQEQPEVVAEEEAVELTGTSFNITDSLEAPLLMDLKGNTSQNTLSGKNLMDLNLSKTQSGNGITYGVASDGTITINGTASANVEISYLNSALQSTANNAYTINFIYISGTLNGTMHVYNQDSNNGWKGYNLDITGTGALNNKTWGSTFNVDLNMNGAKTIRIENGSVLNNLKFKLQFVKGTTDYNYEPYCGRVPSPNPSYPQNVNVVSGNNDIVVCGKNLFNKNDITTGLYYYASGTSASGNWAIAQVRVQPNTNYYLSGNNYNNETARIVLLDSSKNITYDLGGYKNVKSFTTSATTAYVGLSIANYEGSSDLNSIQLELGSTASTYEAYNGTTYNIDLPVENLIDYDNMKATGGYGNEGYLPSNTNYTTIQYIKVQPNTKYTLTTNIDITKYSGLRVSDFNSSKTFIRRNATIDITSQTQTFTTSSDAVYIALSFWTSGTASISDITQAQLELGTKANSFTPYGTTPIELCKIGNYKDSFRRSTGKNLIDLGDTNVKNAYETNSVIVSPNTKYTISYTKERISGATISNNQIYGVGYIVYYNNSTEISRENGTIITLPSGKTDITTTFTTPSYCNRIIINIGNNNGDTNVNTKVSKIQIEEGQTATEYEPYGVGKWYLHKEIGKVVLDGSEDESWSKLDNSSYSSTILRFRTTAITNVYKESDNTISIMSDYFKGELLSVRNKNSIARQLTDVSGINIFIDKNYLSGEQTSNFKTWLGTHNVNVKYVLATPTNTEITYQPLLNQLNALEDAESYEGTTNVNQVNNDLPFIIGLTYFTGDNTITITNDGNIYSKPLLRIKGTSDISISLNGIQIFQITLQNNEIIIIDTEKMEAYYDGMLKNRQVIGDYNNFKLNPGENTIEFNGAFDYVRISRYSRWV